MFTMFTTRPSVYRSGVMGRSHGARIGVASTVTFKALSVDSGAGNIPSALLVNSVSVAPDTRLEAANATTATWTATVGSNLTIASTGTDPSVGVDTPLTGSDKAVTLPAGKVYQAASTTLADVALEDFACEFLYRARTDEASKRILAKRGSAGAGWEVLTIAGARQVRFQIVDAAAGVLSLTSGGLTHQGFVHVMVFVDRSEASANGAALYINGVQEATGNPSTVTGSWTNAKGLCIGADSDLAAKCTQDVSLVSVWKSTGWFVGGASNLTQWAAVAKERFAKLAGVHAQVALGTAVPATMTRPSIAWMDKIDTTTSIRTLFAVGANWPRICRRKEKTGGEFVRGYLFEPSKQNAILQSETFDNASWTKTAATISANATASPTTLTDADGIVGDGTLAQHGVAQAPTLTAAVYTLSVFAKAGNQTHLLLEDQTVANCSAYFNLSTGLLGTVGAGVAEAIIEPWGSGWFRCSIRFTGTVAAHTLAISAASADATPTFTGDAATVNTNIFGAQVELGDHCTSYITTTTAAVTRSVDVLSYTGNDGNIAASSAGTMSVDILAPAMNYTGQWNTVLAGGTTASQNPNGVFLIVDSTDSAFAQYQTASVAQYAIAGTSDVMDGERHTLKTTWATNEGKLLVDGAQQGATDASVTVFSTAPVLISCAGASGANALAGTLQIDNAVI